MKKKGQGAIVATKYM